MQIDGYVSKKNIRRWLENYESLEAGDIMPDALPGNSGPKNYDGVSAGRVNKMMLDQAVGQLSPFMRLVVKCRWTRRTSRRDALKLLGVSQAIYYSHCDLALKLIYQNISGKASGFANLYEKIDNT